MPFVRLLPALAAGVLLQWYFNLSPLLLAIVLALSLTGYLLFYFLPNYQTFTYQWLRGIALLVIISSFGGLLCYSHHPLRQPYHYSRLYESGDAIVATVDEALISKPKTLKANAAVTAVCHHGKLVPASGLVQVYFSKTGIDTALRYGSQILFTKPLDSIKNGGNPGGFDYRLYLLRQGITAQVFLKSGEYKVIASTGGTPLQRLLQQTRRYVISVLQTYIPAAKEQGVAEALLIGYRNDLDKQLVQSYSNTGVVHIIAISGLHLGMIYGFILLLFSPFKHRRWHRYGVPVLAIVVLWLFALIAGAVPSILRSAVTFTFIAIGMFINRRTNIYNTLAASAFCLLLFNPYLLWDVGFQLSYTAVLGIVLFTKPMYHTLYFENKILSRVWQLICMNLAAQILTLPIVLYNFHQFPLLFLINNLIVIPLSEIILFATLLLVLAGQWVWLATWVGDLSQWLLSLMNAFILHSERLPFALWTNIKLDVVEALLLYAAIALLATWLLYKLPRLLLYGLCACAALVLYASADVWQTAHQQKLIVYNIPRHTAIDIITKQSAVCLSDTALANDAQATRFNLLPTRTLHRIGNCSNRSMSAGDNLILQANGKTVCLIGGPLPKWKARQKLKSDLVIITNNPKLYINDLFSKIECKTVIADNNNAFWKIKKWRKDCDSLHIRFHAVADEGAFVMDL